MVPLIPQARRTSGPGVILAPMDNHGTTRTFHSDPPERSGTVVVCGLALALLLAHLLTTGAFGYGFFVDELYFLACSEHLAWGFVDMPPLFPAVMAGLRAALGDSLPVVRLLPTLCAAGLVLLTAGLARSMGGRWRAQALAALAVVVAPLWLLLFSFSSLNALDTLLWPACALVLVRIANGGPPWWWLVLGGLGGAAFNTKHTVAVFAVGLAVGILLSPLRRALGTRWPWLGLAVALLLALPNLLWMVDNGFPHLEQLANIREDGRNVALSPAAFLGQQALMLHPVSTPLWLAGLGWLALSRAGRRFRPLAVAWIVTEVLLIVLDGRTYYAGPAFPMVLAAGGVALERWSDRTWRRRTVAGWAAVLAVGGAAMAPMWLPMLPPGAFIRYRELVGFDQVRVETHRLGPLPQLFADRFGWPELAEEVARAYRALPPGDQARCAIFGQNYGQAGAVDLFGPALGLPKAISGHLSYWLWGPGDATGEVMLVMGDDRETLETLFASVERVGRIEHPLSMPHQHADLWLCRDLQGSMEELWPRVKMYH